MAYGSRLLNGNGSLLGLNVWDLLGAVGVMIGTGECLRPFGMEVMALPLAVLTLVALIPIRLRYRRKILRDTIRYTLSTKVIHVPKHTS